MISLNHNVRLPKQDLLQQLPPRAAILISQTPESLHPIIHQTINIVEYSLGDQILVYHPPTQSSPTQTSEDIVYERKKLSSKDARDCFIGIVCQGRVRLLVSGGQKEITAERLSEDQCFGADHLIVTQPLEYRAVASSPTVKIAQIPLSVIGSIIEVNSAFRQYWLEQTQIREQLSFFRTSTTLKSHPSHSLSQWIPYLQILKITKGTALSTATPAKSGRYWLRSGIISGDASPPTVGDSWGYSSEQATTIVESAVDPSWVRL